MRDTVKFFSVITGFFRSLVTIMFLLGIAFTVLVDTNLLMSFLDLLGFQEIAAGIVKPVFIIIFALLFVVNFIITRHIYKAGITGDYHLSNFVFGLLFLAITGFVFVTFRSFTTNLIFVFFALNGLLVLNSMLGLIAKARGQYPASEAMTANIENPNDFIEFEDSDNNEQILESKAIGINDVVENTGEIKVIKDNKDKQKIVDRPAEDKKESQSEDVKKTIDNSKEKKQEKEIAKADKKTERKVIEKDSKVVFESKKSSVNNKNNENTIKNSRPVEVKKSKTNKISYANTDKDGEIYGEDEANKIRKEKDEKVFDKDQFTGIKVKDINKEEK
ncbi:hypothetical protein [Anaerococcus sp. Marseille-Q5996]|uniref:hypothetical protein n=1 Tax=Anaerococcus sp. Marseille-Q5996 TaxID=2972769 RepID=UPI0021C704E8|nr:hypothetical protein [Anaerococcus sp. Marseille-Q5996]